MSPQGPPRPMADPTTDFFWEAAARRELHIQRCQSCGTYIHLPRPICRSCHSFDLAGERVSGRGTLYSFSETHKAFHPFFVDRVPYLIAVVELVEQPGLRLHTNLVGIGEPDVRFGMQVEVDFEALDAELTIPVFRPAGAAA